MEKKPWKCGGINLFSSINNTLISNDILDIKSSDDGGCSRENGADGKGTDIYITDSFNNTLTEQDITEITNGRDIYLTHSSNNTIIHNNKTEITGEAGIYLYELSKNNKLFLNILINNTQNAKDSGSKNNWDNGSIGNYWDDYDGSNSVKSFMVSIFNKLVISFSNSFEINLKDLKGNSKILSIVSTFLFLNISVSKNLFTLYNARRHPPLGV